MAMVDGARRRQHGYSRGCRCASCRRSWADYMAAYNRARFGVRSRPSKFFDGADKAVPVKLTPLARRILDTTVARTGKKRDDVVERLLRDYGRDVLFSQLNS